MCYNRILNDGVVFLAVGEVYLRGIMKVGRVRVRMDLEGCFLFT